MPKPQVPLMVTSGSPSPFQTYRKRLTCILSILALLGSLTLGIVWWDSTENITVYSTMGQTISIYCSSIVKESQSINGAINGYLRADLQIFDMEDQPLFPRPVFTSYQIAIPIYLLILTYLATLLLIWLVLMNRLARRMFLARADGTNET